MRTRREGQCQVNRVVKTLLPFQFAFNAKFLQNFSKFFKISLHFLKFGNNDYFLVLRNKVKLLKISINANIAYLDDILDPDLAPDPHQENP